MLFRAMILMVFGYLYSLDQNGSILMKILIIGAFAVLGTILLEILKGLLKSLKLGEVKEDLVKAFNRSFMMLLPFMIFTLVSKFYLRWEMVLAFFSTGIMTAGGVLIYELQGKTRMKKILPLFITIYLFALVSILMNLNRIIEKVGGSL